jgi:hypothetical protein
MLFCCAVLCCAALQLGAAVVKAIQNSPLSLNPTNEGNEVLVKLPRLTKDTIGAAAICIGIQGVEFVCMCLASAMRACLMLTAATPHQGHHRCGSHVCCA